MKKKLTYGTLSILLCLSLGACSPSENEKDATITPAATQSAASDITTPAQSDNPDTTIAPDVKDPTPTPDPMTQLSAVYPLLGTIDDEYQFAVVYLGYPEADATDAVITEFKETYQAEAVQRADCDGQEAYAIVPKYQDSTIAVKKYTDAEYTQLESVIETSDPVIVFCNPSDLRSNIEITVTHNGEGIAFGPFISLKDGSVVVPEQAKLVMDAAQ